MNIINKEKLDFLLVENTKVLGNYSYVLSTKAPYFMFQVIGFDTEKEFEDFKAAPKMAYGVIPGYRIVLCLSNALGEPQYDKSKMDGYYAVFTGLLKEVCDWFSAYRDINNSAVYQQFKIK